MEANPTGPRSRQSRWGKSTASVSLQMDPDTDLTCRQLMEIRTLRLKKRTVPNRTGTIAPTAG
jgi:hypothetical protein